MLSIDIPVDMPTFLLFLCLSDFHVSPFFMCESDLFILFLDLCFKNIPFIDRRWSVLWWEERGDNLKGTHDYTQDAAGPSTTI